MAISSHPVLHPALNLWGYGPDSCPDAPRLADWEEARLAAETGSWLGIFTRRPTSSPEPPGPARAGELRRGPVVDGWISTYFGWQRIVQESRFPGPVTVEAEAVMLRLRATSPAGLRDLIGGLVRKQHHNDADDMPPGVALTLGRLQLPDQWMRFVRDGWFAALTQDWRVATARLPEVPGPYERRDLSRLMEWLEQQPGLDRVRDAFAGTDPELVDDAGPSLRYGDPSVADLAERVALGRLLHLYAWALRHGDQPVVELVGDLRHLRDGRQ